MFLYHRVTGGAQAESKEGARSSAPGKMQSLGRLVGLQDYEAETLAIPGVLKAKAAWVAEDGVPMLSVVVLTESGTEENTSRVRDIIRTYNRCRGAVRFPVDVVHGTLQYVYLDITVGFDATYRKTDLTLAIRQALGAEDIADEEGGSGLFSPHQRQFGESVHRSHIVAAVQRVVGVTWVKLTSARLMDMSGYTGSDPATLPRPLQQRAHNRLRARTSGILALHNTHLVVNFSRQEVAEECRT